MSVTGTIQTINITGQLSELNSLREILELFWMTLISATIEDANPTDVILTFPSPAALNEDDFTITGFSIASSSWNGAVLTLVLTEAVTAPDGDLEIYFVDAPDPATIVNNTSWEIYFETRTPSNLILTPIPGEGINVLWDDAVNPASGIRIYYSSDGGQNYILGETVDYGVEEGNLTGLTNWVNYTVRIVAFNGINESDPLIETARTISFILRDEFVTNDDAPVTSPRTMEPDGGVITLVQNDGQMSIVDSFLNVPAQVTPAYGDLSAYFSNSINKVLGLAFSMLIKHIAFDSGQFGGFKLAANGGFAGTNIMLYRDAYGIQIQTAAGGFRRGISDPPLSDTAHEKVYTVVMRTTGLFFFINDMLVFIEHSATFSSTFYGFANYTQQFKKDFDRVSELPAPFNVDNGIALYSTDTPVNGVTITGSEDGNISFAWTPGAGEVLNIRFRREDDDNCMIIRCSQASNIIQLIRRWAGVETQFGGNLSATFNAGTLYPIYVRYFKDRFYAGIDSTGAGSAFAICSYNLHSTGVKVDGFSSASRLQVFPFYMSGTALGVLNSFNNPFISGARTRKTVSVANGGNIAAAIATMNGGDILSLAAGGTYNISAGATAIGALPNGHSLMWTEIRGNGATIIGGAEGLYNIWGRFWSMYDLNFLNQTVHCHNLIGCRDFIHDNCTFASTGQGSGFFDSTHFDKCENFVVRNSKAGPSNGSTSCDGFEMYGDCRNGLFEDCEAEGVVHGFEIWSGSAPNWENKNIILRRCYAHACTGGFSVEGGVQGFTHLEIFCYDCAVDNNGIDGDYHASENGILRRSNSPGVVVETNGGQVIDL